MSVPLNLLKNDPTLLYKKSTSQLVVMGRVLRLCFFSLLVLSLSPNFAYAKKQKLEIKSGTMVYAAFGRSDAMLFFYLNDAGNTLIALNPSASPFSGCNELPCLSAQTELTFWQIPCTGVWASPFCATTKDYSYALTDHNGTPSIEIGFGAMGWIAMPYYPISASALNGSFISRISALDADWKPSTPGAWNDESAKLRRQFGQQKEQEADAQFACITHLKIDDPVSLLDKCGHIEPDHTNSDLRGEQRIYYVAAWYNGRLVGHHEVLVYVDTRNNAIQNVQWDDKIHSD